MPHDVFISYPSADKAAADAVCAALEGRRRRCWIAPRDVVPGRPYATQILDAIAGARAMVLVFSAHANRSDHVMREVEAALDGGLPLLPLRIEDVPPTGGLDYYLRTIHWLDALTPPLEAHLDGLADSVERLLGTEGAPPEPGRRSKPAPPPPPQGTGRRRAAGALGVVLVLGAILTGLWLHRDGPPPAGAPGGRDLQRLQGFWTLVATEEEGKRTSVQVGDLEIEFRGDRMFTYEGRHAPTGGPLVFRGDLDPPGFDQIFEYERDGRPVRGRITWIYRFLDEDHLEMAYPREDSFDRPSALVPRGFDSTKEPIAVVTLERRQAGR